MLYLFPILEDAFVVENVGDVVDLRVALAASALDHGDDHFLLGCEVV